MNLDISKGVFGSWKIRRKEKNLKSNFLSIVWFEECQKKKKREENCKEHLSCYEEKIFLPNMRGKWRKKLILIVCRKRK